MLPIYLESEEQSREIVIKLIRKCPIKMKLRPEMMYTQTDIDIDFFNGFFLKPFEFELEKNRCQDCII